MALTITAANSIFAIAIKGLFDSPQILQGFAADAAFTTEAVDSVETVMGVDGRFSAGWVPMELRQTITIMPNSPSADVFERWYLAQQTIREVYAASAVITIPSIKKEYTCTEGYLSSYTPIAEVAKVLRARTFSITWGFISPAPV